MSKYLSLLDGKAERFLFACFDYRKQKKGKILYGPFDECEPVLKKHNGNSYCVYVTVNETKGPERKLESIIRARAIWVEDDEQVDKPRTDFPLEPSMIVQSSPGKYHYYWLTSTTKLDEWDAVMQTMVDKWGCDKKARDRARVMRLPGFKHNKDLSTKDRFVCELVSSKGTVYSWLQLKTTFPPSDTKSKSSKPGSTRRNSDYSESETLNELLTSKNYHGSLVSISMSLSNRGVSRELQHATLVGLMNAIPVSKRREEWEARASDEHIYECIDSAIEKIEGEKESEIAHLDDIQETSPLRVDDLDWPPGLMGELCQEIHDMSPYPNRSIALSGAVGLVAGIVGRRYNVLGMGLNLYIAILADSGIGKAALKDSINKALRGGKGSLNLGASFLGRSRFTGPKAIFDMLSTGLSRICVIEEAGLVHESGTGDQSGINRAMLDLFTSSGYGKWAGDEGYSNKDNSIPALHSPALSVISVSTPKSFLKSMKTKSADVSGEVARLWMLRTMSDKPYLNRNRLENFSGNTVKRIGDLIKHCLPVQQTEAVLEVIDMDISEQYYQDADKWVDLENKFIREGDHLKRTLCSRAWAKIIKIAAVVSVFNNLSEIGHDEYVWASEMVKRELSFIQDTFSYEASDDLIGISRTIVGSAIVKSLKGKYKDLKKNAPEELAKYGVFTPYSINQILRNNAVLKSMDDDTTRNNPKTGLQKVLAHMVQTGLLTICDHHKMMSYQSRSKLGYKITADFELMMNGEEDL